MLYIQWQQTTSPNNTENDWEGKRERKGGDPLHEPQWKELDIAKPRNWVILRHGGIILNPHNQWICEMVWEDIFLLGDLHPHYTKHSYHSHLSLNSVSNGSGLSLRVRVRVVNKPDPFIQVRLHRILPTLLNWAGTQWVVQRVHL